MLTLITRVCALPALQAAGCAAALATGTVLALWGTQASAQQDVQQRKQELRSSVKQHGANQPPVAPAAADGGLRHLSPQERGELRRQLTRELRVQPPSVLPVSR